MCFSANASFGAGAVLTVIGIVSIKKAQHPSQILFASIPLLFAFQQLSEGILWLTLPNPDYINIQHFFTIVFIFFAQVLWPLWASISVLLLEKKSTRKKIQKVIVGMGVVASIYLAFCLISYPVQAKIIGYHISYEVNYPIAPKNFIGLFYIIATIAAPFFSHIKRMWMLGTTILISYIITSIFYENYLVSVWCFFASIISVSVYAIMIEIKNAHAEITVPLKITDIDHVFK